VVGLWYGRGGGGLRSVLPERHMPPFKVNRGRVGKRPVRARPDALSQTCDHQWLQTIAVGSSSIPDIPAKARMVLDSGRLCVGIRGVRGGAGAPGPEVVGGNNRQENRGRTSHKMSL